MAADGTIKIYTEVDTKGIQTGTKQIESSMSKTGSIIKKIGGLIAAAFAVQKITQFGKECLELGSDLQEVQNVVDSVFTTMSDKVDDFAKNAAVTAGLSETMAKKYVGTFGAMAKSFGFAESEALNMSTSLTQLSGDVASFYNLTQDEAYTKLKSVFTGETESLKELGVVMTQSALDQYALANGFGKTTSAMTEQEKVALRYQFVMNQLTTASGDFIRTSGGWANQVRVLKLQIESLKATIGQGLINIFTPVIKVINVLLAKLATVANAFKAFTELITGNKSSGSTSTTDTGIDSSGYTEAAESAQDVADATDNIASSTKKAAKEQKKYLSGLDEIRKYGEESYETPDTTGGSGTSAGGLNAAIGNVDYGNVAEGTTVLEKTETLLDRIIKQLKKLQKLFKKGFWNGLGEYKPILDELEEDIKSIGESLKEIWKSPEVLDSAERFSETLAYSLGKITGSMANVGLNLARMVVGGIEKYLSQSKGRISDFFVEMFDIGTQNSTIAANFSAAISEIFSAVGEQEAQTLIGTVLSIFSELGMILLENCARIGRDVFGALTQPFIDNSELIRAALIGTLAAIQPFVDGILTAVQNLRDKFSEFYNVYMKPFLENIGAGLSQIFSTLLNGYNEYVRPVIESLSQKFREFMEGPFGELVEGVIGFMEIVIVNLQKIWNEILVPLIDWIVKNILPVLMPIVETLGKITLDWWGTLCEVGDGILQMLGGLIDFLVGNFTGDWEQAYGGLEDIGYGFQKAIESIFGFVQNSILRPFSDFLSGIFEKDWSESFGELGEILNSFFDGVEQVWEDIKKVLNSIITFINNVFSGNWRKAWESIKNVFKRVFDGLVNLARNPLNGIIGAFNGIISVVNGLISKINGISFRITVPEWIPGIGGSWWQFGGFNIPYLGNIPYLAQGAIIPPNAPFMAMLGDQKNGTNLEAPESLIRQIMREELANAQQSGGRWQFTAQLNRRTLFDEFIEEAKLRQMTTGRNPLEFT